ncbi:MAG: hypothetical protein LKF37_04750 [Lentilactobacillus diolivorans]|jgi:hypothetical protein|nr:hypothetical protein [Lentilactobacillus diolivorans]RRG01976.1 MAG: hypothetical protein DUD34_10170 [Lactobacillus sp.]
MNKEMVDIKKQIKFLMLLIPSLIIGFILNQSSTTQAATDRFADSYYLNDSDTWTHYFSLLLSLVSVKLMSLRGTLFQSTLETW